ncbi:cupin domain-containing protein [Rhodocytophaga rosea]|uniref:Cupin domain-containing protein n=1 Tax=Rhodocytophaga rosea TaxID=2704465 RepID=A0A6C0GMD3_9BACT|nr:cupin domain-containing protein [Rhodocytophaga rosea]QHT68783.1 cupin domain-containing protein [Rhodocytophaga rosea]
MHTIHLTKANTGKHFLLGSDMITVKAGSQETSGTMLAMEVKVPKGGGPPMLHRHTYSETFYFLEGEFIMTTANSDYQQHSVRVQPGDTLAIPSMVWHTFRNSGDTEGKFLVVHSSPVMEGLLQELGNPIQDMGHLPVLETPPSATQMQAMLQVLGKYMEFLPAEKLST